jgi:hypothetical protein
MIPRAVVENARAERPLDLVVCESRDQAARVYASEEEKLGLGHKAEKPATESDELAETLVEPL